MVKECKAMVSRNDRRKEMTQRMSCRPRGCYLRALRPVPCVLQYFPRMSEMAQWDVVEGIVKLSFADTD